MNDALAALHANYRRLARYNAWMNERLYDAAERLPDADRKRDRGAFFGSIHGTLEPPAVGRSVVAARFAAQGVAFPALAADLLAMPEGATYGTVLHEDWQELRGARRGSMQPWCAGPTRCRPASRCARCATPTPRACCASSPPGRR
jgi:hypothetical protein